MAVSYLMLTASVIMFGVQFRLNQIYEKEAGSSTRATLVFIAGYSVVGVAVLAVINGIRFETTPFTLLIAAISAVDFIAYSFFSVKAFSKVNLSLFSIFSMLGGMLLPFVAGIVFFREGLTIGKILCIVFLIAAVCVTFERKKKKSGLGYCLLVFFTNGMAGVLSKIFQSAPYPKTNEAMYSILCAAGTGLIAAVSLLFVKGEKVRLNKKIIISMAGYGALNRVANYLLLLALAVLPASVQYPFVTGGVMVVSFLIGLLTHQKPTKRELFSVLLSGCGIAALMVFA